MKTPKDRSSVIEKRKYQELILKKLDENYKQGINTIAEVDTGLGKRVLTYLLIQDVFPEKKVLLLLHSTTSFLETVYYFQNKYGGFKSTNEFQTISSRTPNWLRNKILKDDSIRVIAATPQTFFNALIKLNPQEKPSFEVIIINEIDKIVRRQGDSRVLIFPYNVLLSHFVHSSWLLGMTGTMRDKHILYSPNEESITIQYEISTLDKQIPNLQIIRMDDLLKQTNISDYLKYTYIKRVPVEAGPELSKIFELIDQTIKEHRKMIIEETMDERPTLFDSIPKDQLALVSGVLEAKQSQKYKGLLLIRKYCTSMQAKKFKKFLYRLKKFGISKELIQNLPERSTKINTILNLLSKEYDNKKVVILCSYLDTAHLLEEEITKRGMISYLITGEVKHKEKVLEEFKHSPERAVLVMTSVGERDIDIPQADLLIMYDTINTIKTNYQRMKRTRGGVVLFLYYKNTFEERKVNRVLNEISKMYHWSSIIDE